MDGGLIGWGNDRRLLLVAPWMARGDWNGMGASRVEHAAVRGGRCRDTVGWAGWCVCVRWTNELKMIGSGGASSLKDTDVSVSGAAWSCVVACYRGERPHRSSGGAGLGVDWGRGQSDVDVIGWWSGATTVGEWTRRACWYGAGVSRAEQVSVRAVMGWGAIGWVGWCVRTKLMHWTVVVIRDGNRVG